MKPRLHSRAVLGPLHPSVPSSHNIERICYCTHSTGMKLRLAQTELFPQGHRGVGAGAAWLGCSRSLHSPSLPCITRLSIISWPEFLKLPGFQFSVPNWNQILLTLEMNTVNQRAVCRINERLSRRGSKKATREQEANSSPRCGCSTWTQRAGPGQVTHWAACPSAWRGRALGEGPAAPPPQPTAAPLGQLIIQEKAEISIFCDQIWIVRNCGGLHSVLQKSMATWKLRMWPDLEIESLKVSLR